MVEAHKAEEAEKKQLLQKIADYEVEGFKTLTQLYIIFVEDYDSVEERLQLIDTFKRDYPLLWQAYVTRMGEGK